MVCGKITREKQGREREKADVMQLVFVNTNYF